MRKITHVVQTSEIKICVLVHEMIVEQSENNGNLKLTEKGHIK